MTSSTDRIEKSITIQAPRSRVWRALADAGEFGKWFGANLQGQVLCRGRPPAETSPSPVLNM